MRRLALSFVVLVVVGCGGGTGPSRCIPGDSKPCAGPGQCIGYQVCRADGTYAPCNCGSGPAGAGGTAGSGGAGGMGGIGGSSAGGTGGSSAGGTGGSSAGGTGGTGGGGRGGAGGPASCASAAGASGTGGTGGTTTSPDAGRDHYAGDGPSSDVAFQTFCSAVRASMIARNERCAGMTSLQADAVVGIDPCAAWGSALDTGRMTFDGSKAAACAAALVSHSCAGDLPAACDRVLTGLVPNYSGVGSAGDCQPARQLALDGQTVPPGAFAATASLFTECVPGSFCVVRDATAVGPRFVCSPRPGVGDVCSSTTAPCYASVCDHTGRCAVAKVSGEICVASSDCAAGLYCDSSSTCAPKHATGGCTSAGECIAPATCDNGSCGIRPRGACCTNTGITDCAGGEYCGQGTTRRCYTAPVIGQPCMLGFNDCWVGHCELVGGTASGTCAVGQPGSNCTLSARNASCGPNALCLLTSGVLTCQAPGF